MRRLLILAVAILPLLLFSCKKNKNNPPVQPGVYYEFHPVSGRTSITFHNKNAFTVQNLSAFSLVKYEYTYRIENGKMIVTPPPIDSYAPPGPLTFALTADGVLYIDNFRPSLWPEKINTFTFKRQ